MILGKPEKLIHHNFGRATSIQNNFRPTSTVHSLFRTPNYPDWCYRLEFLAKQFLRPSLLITLALLFSPLIADTISSDRAGYDGSALVLNGRVQLDHTLGSMNAQFARLEKSEKEGPFTAILLKDDVTIALKNHGRITCDEADLNIAKRVGHLLPKAGEKIVFQEMGNEPFCLLCRWAEVEFLENDEEISVSVIKANDDVQVEYGDHLCFEAKSATYFPGEDQKVAFTSPKGTFRPAATEDSEVTFECDRMVWHPGSQSLTLIGNVSVEEEDFGKLSCDEEIILNQVKNDGQWSLATISTKGLTQFDYQSIDGEDHRLLCPGMMHLDRDSLILTMRSPEKKAIEYRSGEMKLVADDAKVHFREMKQGKALEQLTLSGNILLSSAKQQNPTRCALADTFSYSPDDQTVVLATHSGARVLFWDASEELSVSAREVHITRTDEGDNIKGVGNVHFSFSSAENELLHKLFPFYNGGHHGR